MVLPLHWLWAWPGPSPHAWTCFYPGPTFAPGPASVLDLLLSWCCPSPASALATPLPCLSSGPGAESEASIYSVTSSSTLPIKELLILLLQISFKPLSHLTNLSYRFYFKIFRIDLRDWTFIVAPTSPACLSSFKFFLTCPSLSLCHVITLSFIVGIALFIVLASIANSATANSAFVVSTVNYFFC